MKRQMLVILTVVSLMFPGIPLAKGQGAEQGKTMKMSGQMHTNMAMMADMMTKMHKMLSKGKMDREQMKQCLNVMEGMSQMMREMSVPHGKKVREKHQKELLEMQKTINPLFDHLLVPG